ncbi:glycosyltransferase [Candidatus Neomarinimicrobiota bacterium]
MINEFRRQGHEIITLPFPEQNSVEETLRLILLKSMECKPDAIVTLNGMGFDKKGYTISMLSELALPVVIWYLDNHQFIGPYFEDTIPDWAIAFTYEKALLKSLQSAGFQHTFYLPLATDPDIGNSIPSTSYEYLRDRITYVGSTFSATVNKYHTPEFEKTYHAWNPDFSSLKQQQGRINLDAEFAQFRDTFTDIEDFRLFTAYVTASEIRRHRAGRLSCLTDQPLVVFGSEDWSDYLPHHLLRPPVDYKYDRSHVYRNSAVNLSFTALQQETALNQRYFDVPMSGGFLVGEWQEALTDHFALDTEAVYFRDDHELRDKTRYYLNHPSEREKIIRRARERVLSEHLMEHRVQAMLSCIKQICK